MTANPMRFVPFALVLAFGASRTSALAADAAPQPPVREMRSVLKVNFTLLGGLSLPVCKNQQGCDGNLAAGPSIGGLLLFAPNEQWAVGFAGQMSRLHWRETYLGMADGKTYYMDSDLTSGFVAVAARYVPLPALRVTPIVQAALGTGFQWQTGNNPNCNDGYIPTGQLAAGGRARLSSQFSVFALASATWGYKPSNCAVSDGPGATPFAGWGFGLHTGVAFEVPL